MATENGDAEKDEAKNGDDARPAEPAMSARIVPAPRRPKLTRPQPTVIDLAGIGNRILSLPIPSRNYTDLSVGKSGVMFLAEGAPVGRPSEEDGTPIRALWRFTTEKRLTERDAERPERVQACRSTARSCFTAREDNWFLAAVSELKPGSPDAAQGKPVNNGGMSAMLDLRAQWKQMYRETWRLQRDFLYDPPLHGLDLNKIEAKYAALPRRFGLARRVHLSMQ